MANQNKSYKELHRPAREFKTREEYREHELEIFQPRRWRLNLPWRDFRFEIEDIVPAISGTLGNTVLALAIVGAYATGFGLSDQFVVENVRFEMLLVALLFVIPISGFFNPRANLPGAHGPMIPLVGMIVVAGGHPLALGVLISVLGLVMGFIKGGSRLVRLTGNSIRGGLLIILGIKGLLGQMSDLRVWANARDLDLLFLVVIGVTVIIYAYLARLGKRWLAIPLCAFMAAIIAVIKGAQLDFVTQPGIPNMNPFYWWGEDTGWMIGLPDWGHFIAVLPFALLAIAMWPPDFLGHRVFQELNYPKKADKALMDVDDTMVNCSIRQGVGSLLGGGNLTSSWGTYLIPAAIAKRPIPAGALLTGLLMAISMLLGYPVDIAIFKPVLTVALIVGVFLPLLEAGLAMIQSAKDAEGAGIVIFGSVLVNPIFGWAFATLLDNIGLIDRERARSLPVSDRIIIPLITFIVCTVVMAVTGLIPGIAAMV